MPISVDRTPTYGECMTKRSVDIDDSDLDAAREALATSSISETVRRAPREAAAAAARRREIERLASGSAAALADPEARRQAWR